MSRLTGQSCSAAHDLHACWRRNHTFANKALAGATSSVYTPCFDEYVDSDSDLGEPAKGLHADGGAAQVTLMLRCALQ